MNSAAYKLERLATKLNKEGNPDGAVQALKKAQALGSDVGPRLLKYLQRAGRYEEALQELECLVSVARVDVPALMRNKTADERDEVLASTLSRLYADGALIARRQKDATREAEFSRLASHHREKLMRLRPINAERRATSRLMLQKNKSNKPVYYRLLRMFFPGRDG